VNITPTPAADRHRNTARRLLNEGETQQYATDYLVGFYGIDERTAQIAVLDVSYPGGFQAWMSAPSEEI
jgi:hypothetical protein